MAKKASKKSTKKAAPKKGGIVNKGYTALFLSILDKKPMTMAESRKAVLKSNPDCKVNFSKTVKSLVAQDKAKVDKKGVITLK